MSNFSNCINSAFKALECREEPNVKIGCSYEAGQKA